MKDLGFKSHNRPEILIFSKTSNLILSPFRLLLSNESGDFFPTVMRPACETDPFKSIQPIAFAFKACLGKTVPSCFCTRSFINLYLHVFVHVVLSIKILKRISVFSDNGMQCIHGSSRTTAI